MCAITRPVCIHQSRFQSHPLLVSKILTHSSSPPFRAQFGRSLVFLRNGVEATLNAAVASQMKAVIWFQKVARSRHARSALISRRRAADERRHADAQRMGRAAPAIQAAARGRLARNATAAARAATAAKLEALAKVAAGLRIARTLGPRRHAWIAPRRAARARLQRIARGLLGRLHARRALAHARRPPALQRLRRALRLCLLALRAVNLLREGCACRKLQSVSRRRASVHAANRRRSSVASVQRSVRGQAGRRAARARRLAVCRLQAAALELSARRRRRRELGAASDSLFTAVFEDDEEAVARRLTGHAHLLLVRQDVGGQRAGLAHAAAAGGATRVAPALYLQMHRAARAMASQTEPTRQDVAAELRDALAYCVQLRDAAGRTPLHYAARAGRLAFVQWCVRLLSLRPPGELGADDLFSFGLGSSAAADALDADEAELRRGLLPVVLPGGGARQRALVVLRQMSLRVYALPRALGSMSAGEVELAEKPLLTLQCDKLLYRRSADRAKRDVVEVVLLKPGRTRRQVAAAFESNGDVLELHMGGAAEARAWLAALHSPRYLLSRGMHLASAVAGREAAPEQLDLWERWAVVNHRDGRGETMLHAAARGTEAGETDERPRLLAWLVDAGALVLPQQADEPNDEALTSLYRRFSSPRLRPSMRTSLRRSSEGTSGGTKSSLLGDTSEGTKSSLLGETALLGDTAEVTEAQAVDVPSVFELLSSLACRRSAEDPAYDLLFASTLASLAHQTAAQVGRTPVAAHLAELAARCGAALADAGARATLASLASTDADVDDLPVEVQMRPPPPPTADSQNRSLVMLSLTRLDCAADPSTSRLAVSMVHEPTNGPSHGRRRSLAAASLHEGSLASRAAAFENASPQANASPLPPALPARGSKLATRLATLVSEQVSSRPSASSASGILWWFRTWTAAYLPGEEGALLVIKLLRTGDGAEVIEGKEGLSELGSGGLGSGGDGSSGDAVLGWVALPLEEIGEHHLQMHAPPLPKTLAEARAPKLAKPTNAWLHCELSLGVTGSYAAFAARHAELARGPTGLSEEEAALLERRGSVDFFPRASTADASPPRPPSPVGTGAPKTPALCDGDDFVYILTLATDSREGQPPPPLPRSPPPPPTPLTPHAPPSVPPTPQSVLHTPPPPPRTPPPPLPSSDTVRKAPRYEKASSSFLSPYRLHRVGSSFLSPRTPLLTPRSSALSEKETRAAVEMLDALPEAPIDLVPLLLSGKGSASAGSAAQRERVIELVKAAAAATRGGEHELAARGYLHAFALCGSTSLLISVANMFVRLGISDAADRIFAHLAHTPSLLSADQNSLVLLRLEQIRSGAPPAMLQPRLSAVPTFSNLWPEEEEEDDPLSGGGEGPGGGGGGGGGAADASSTDDAALVQLRSVLGQPAPGAAGSFLRRQEAVYSPRVLAGFCAMLNEPWFTPRRQGPAPSRQLVLNANGSCGGCTRLPFAAGSVGTIITPAAPGAVPFRCSQARGGCGVSDVQWPAGDEPSLPDWYRAKRRLPQAGAGGR